MSDKQDIKDTNNAGKSKKTSELQSTFVPKFWSMADNRVAIIKEIKNRVQELQESCGADSLQKKIITQRIIFLSIKLESAELQAIETGVFNSGEYAMLINSLLGCLKSIGLDKKCKKVQNLKQYLESKEQKNN